MAEPKWQLYRFDKHFPYRYHSNIPFRIKGQICFCKEWAGFNLDPNRKSFAFPVCKICDKLMHYTIFQCIGCVQPTSAESERVFSTGSLTVSDLRKCLSAEHVDALIFLKRNIGDLGWQNADEWIPAVRAGFTNEDAVAAAMRS